MTINELDILKTDKVRQIIANNLTIDPSVFALKNRHSAAATLATQLKYLQRSRAKLPSFYAVQAIVPPLAFEQCSSERAASAKDFSGTTCLDLTCGLGVDSLHFSKSFQQITAIERNLVLANTVRFNFELMKIENIKVINTTAEDFVNNYDGAPFDLIYLDPARRDSGGKKVFLPEDCEPNFVELLPILAKISKKIVVKMSPLYDVDAAFRQFGNVSEVGVISVDNECKELLLVFNSMDLINKNKPLNSDLIHEENTINNALINENRTINNVLINELNPFIFIKCFFKNQFYLFKKNAELNTHLKANFHDKHNENKMLCDVLAINSNFNSELNNDINFELINENKLLNNELINENEPLNNELINQNKSLNSELINQNKSLNTKLNSPLITAFNYLIEPDVAFYKARFLENIPPPYFAKNKTILTASNGFFLTDDISKTTELPARIFRIEAAFDYQPKRIAAYLKTEKITALNVVQRNFPFSAADIRAALRVREGGDWFLICTLWNGEKKAWLAKRI